MGKRFPLLGYTDIDNKLNSGRWLVVFYHHDCNKCQAAVRELHQVTSKLRVERVALVEMAPFGPSGNPTVCVRDASVCGRLSGARDWFAETPIGVVLENGLVMDFIKSSEF